MDRQKSKDKFAKHSEMKGSADEQVTERYAKTLTSEDFVERQDIDDNTKPEDSVLNIHHACASSVVEQSNECNVARSIQDGIREGSYVRDDESQSELLNQVMERDVNGPNMVFRTPTNDNAREETYYNKPREANADLSSFSRNKKDRCSDQNKNNYNSEDNKAGCGQKKFRYSELSDILEQIKLRHILEAIVVKEKLKIITPLKELTLYICVLPDELPYLKIRGQDQDESIITLILRNKALRKAYLVYESFRLATFGVGNNQPLSVSVSELAKNGYFCDHDGTILNFCCSCKYHPTVDRNHSLHFDGCESIHSLWAEGISIRDQYHHAGSWLLCTNTSRPGDSGELGVIIRATLQNFFGTVNGGRSGRENCIQVGQTVPECSRIGAYGTENCPNQSQSATNVTPLPQALLRDSYVQPTVPQIKHFDSANNVDVSENRNPKTGIRNDDVSSSDETYIKQTIVTVESSVNQSLNARQREENCQLSENFSVERPTSSFQGANSRKLRRDFPRDKESTESPEKNSLPAQRSNYNSINTLQTSCQDAESLDISNPNDSCLQNFGFSCNTRVLRKRSFSESDATNTNLMTTDMHKSKPS